MDPALLHATERLLQRHDILGIAVWEKDQLIHQQTAPCWSLEQLKNLGQNLHALFSGYQNGGRNVSGLALQYDERYLQVLVLNKQETPYYLAALTATIPALEMAADILSTWTIDQLAGEKKKSPLHLKQPRLSAQQIWGQFLLRLRRRLESSLGPELGAEVLQKALQAFAVSPTQPLADGQWIFFLQHVEDQITDPQALQRFNQLRVEGEEKSS
jgi:hypothetical protein